ncbi:hypothetical protein B0H17DRAFT_1180099 [Mycena rosella]|uniref:Uncharacterized protein n=1 Tax=Mycena rosella TaxID=1033263 RepID=A0AAD7GIQ5_MYCRO|nr:hypothetical protein B0H17DRAFT_1180099 [Mycena rosella]
MPPMRTHHTITPAPVRARSPVLGPVLSAGAAALPRGGLQYEACGAHAEPRPFAHMPHTPSRVWGEHVHAAVERISAAAGLRVFPAYASAPPLCAYPPSGYSPLGAYAPFWAHISSCGAISALRGPGASTGSNGVALTQTIEITSTLPPGDAPARHDGHALGAPSTRATTSHTGAIVGGVVGGLALLALVGVLGEEGEEDDGVGGPLAGSSIGGGVLTPFIAGVGAGHHQGQQLQYYDPRAAQYGGYETGSEAGLMGSTASGPTSSSGYPASMSASSPVSQHYPGAAVGYAASSAGGSSSGGGDGREAAQGARPRGRELVAASGGRVRRGRDANADARLGPAWGVAESALAAGKRVGGRGAPGRGARAGPGERGRDAPDPTDVRQYSVLAPQKALDDTPSLLAMYLHPFAFTPVALGFATLLTSTSVHYYWLGPAL